MSWLFGQQKTPKEILRENQRMLRRSMRDLDRERTTLQNQEKKTIIETKNLARQGQMEAAKIMAKDLVRTRSQITKLYKMKAQLSTLSARLQTMQSTQAMGQALQSTAMAMMRMNKTMNLGVMQKIMMEFDKQSEMMEMKGEMMNDALDDAMDEDVEEEESEDVINQVLDEIGIDLSTKMVKAPISATATKVATKRQAVAEGADGADSAAPAAPDPVESDLQARLNALKK
eukprot:CAMPEP_0177654660 /NCGR_PEP_ID=MMETSP0447-20121125/14467_1 /TAXON_ID=0 /ORGANISM="Stygamoeba regulata, Strain BSH-02190019" /LENGTH=229 /DNA_ID=CAMNT_0019158357 /DNA_START=48 /DNA_END=737 /DNA_ORIENTATION=+